MKKLASLLSLGAIALGLVLYAQNNRAPSQPFNVVEAGIPAMRAAMEQGRITSRDLVTQYLVRIALYEDKLHAAITVNRLALQEADERDRERAQGHVRGPLHGIPIALKDNIQTSDLRTTGGALAFEALIPPYDATLRKNLTEAGAIIIAKTGLTELANWVAGSPTPMPGNYNAVGGFGMNPYDPRRDPRDATAKSKIGKDGFQVHVKGGIATWTGNTNVIQHKGAATRMARTAGAIQVVNNIKISDTAANPLRRVQVTTN